MSDDDIDLRLARAIGVELGDRPEADEWTHERPDLLTMSRLVALCGRLGVSAPDLLARALARAESSTDEPV